MIPKVIKVGHRQVAVVLRNRDDDAWLGDDAIAYFVSRNDTIVIDATIPLHMKRQALLHEIFHALLSHREDPKGDQTPEDLEHWFIKNIEEGLLNVIRDNPKLVSFLTERD